MQTHPLAYFVRRLPSLSLLLLCASCARSPEAPASAGKASAATTSGCERLRGASFRSKKLVLGGLGPDGPIMGHQYLSFSPEGSSYCWTVEDMSATSGYRCTDGSIRAQGTPFTNGEGFTATYDPARDVLVWHGLEFERVDQRAR